MSETGYFTRAQFIAGFWALFGLWNAGSGAKRLLADGLGVGSAGYLTLGVAGVALAAYYSRNPGSVARGTEHVDRRVEAIVIFALAFVATAAVYVLLA
ncbi:hypothetical protein [Halobacterium zhouii]|uniref:hypothetical protein n=1 Tax=Halobacterium zhouii TaxID=2902624 RepID=UPI001E64D763|nr:hypothetical protein [Halobacterium zhouii]